MFLDSDATHLLFVASMRTHSEERVNISVGPNRHHPDRASMRTHSEERVNSPTPPRLRASRRGFNEDALRRARESQRSHTMTTIADRLQ